MFFFWPAVVPLPGEFAGDVHGEQLILQCACVWYQQMRAIDGMYMSGA